MTDFGTPAGALDRSVLYTRVKYCPTLPLKAFRREPAITQLDKSFAPILSRSPCSDSLSLRLPFRLGLPDTVTRGLIMQKANGRVPKHAPIACGRTISGLFHSASSGSFRLSLAVLVRYRSSGFTCSALLGILVGPVGLSAMGLSPAAAQLSSCVRLAFPVPCPSPATPGSKLPGLGSCAFARRYLRNVV